MNRIKAFFEKVPTKLIVGIDVLLILLMVFGVYRFFYNPPNLNFSDAAVKKAAAGIVASCKQANTETCYKDQLVGLVNDESFFFAEAALYAMQDLDPYTKSCHVLAHHMSRALNEQDPDNWLTQMDQVNANTCGSGFLHGVLEARLGQDPNFVVDSQFINETCGRNKDGYKEQMCIHLMGHILLLNADGIVSEALTGCSEVKPHMKFNCYDGLFMEDHQKLALAEHQIASLPNYDAQYPKQLEQDCLDYQGIEATACWTEMAEIYAKSYGYDANKIYTECTTKAPDRGTQRACYFKGIVILATYPLEQTPEKLSQICNFYVKDESTYKPCVANLISSLLYYSPKFTSRGITVCSNSSVHKEWCFTELGRQLTNFVPDITQRENLCQVSEEKYKLLCMNPI